MTTGCTMEGSAEARAIECGPDPGIANSIKSASAAALAAMMAARRLPGPESAVVVTVYVTAETESGFDHANGTSKVAAANNGRARIRTRI